MFWTRRSTPKLGLGKIKEKQPEGFVFRLMIVVLFRYEPVSSFPFKQFIRIFFDKIRRIDCSKIIYAGNLMSIDIEYVFHFTLNDYSLKSCKCSYRLDSAIFQSSSYVVCHLWNGTQFLIKMICTSNGRSINYHNTRLISWLPSHLISTRWASKQTKLGKLCFEYHIVSEQWDG